MSYLFAGAGCLGCPSYDPRVTGAWRQEHVYCRGEGERLIDRDRSIPAKKIIRCVPGPDGRDSRRHERKGSARMLVAGLRNPVLLERGMPALVVI